MPTLVEVGPHSLRNRFAVGPQKREQGERPETVYDLKGLYGHTVLCIEVGQVYRGRRRKRLLVSDV